MASDVDRYLANYVVYKASKVLQDKTSNLLHSFFVFDKP